MSHADMPLNRFHSYLALAAVVVIGLLTIIGSSGFLSTVSQVQLPERYLLATTPLITPASVETYVSPDGIRWCGFNSPRDMGGNPRPAMPGVPPGVGSNNELFMLAWFAPSGVLTTSTSTNGLVWNDVITHGAFSVDQFSRPAVAFDFDNERWVVAFRLSNDTITVMQVMPSSGPVITVSGVTTSNLAPALAWVDDNFVLAYRDPSSHRIRVLLSPDETSWPSGGGADAMDSANAAILTEEASPFLSNSFPGTLFLTTKRLTPATMLSDAEVPIYSSANGLAWILERTISPTNPFSRGAAIAGPLSEQIMADSSGGNTTDVWFNTTKVTTFPTRTQHLEVSVAHGPNGPGPCRRVEITFSQFKRLPGPFPVGDTEDVTLGVEHFDLAGRLRTAMPPRTVTGAVKASTNFWNLGTGTPLPTFVSLVQPEEPIVLSVTGDSGTVVAPLTLLDIESMCPTTGRALDVGNTLSYGYQLIIRCSSVTVL